MIAPLLATVIFGSGLFLGLLLLYLCGWGPGPRPHKPSESGVFAHVNGHVVQDFNDLDSAIRGLEPGRLVRVGFEDGRIRWARITPIRSLEILPRASSEPEFGPTPQRSAQRALGSLN